MRDHSHITFTKCLDFWTPPCHFHTYITYQYPSTFGVPPFLPIHCGRHIWLVPRLNYEGHRLQIVGHVTNISFILSSSRSINMETSLLFPPMLLQVMLYHTRHYF